MEIDVSLHDGEIAFGLLVKDANDISRLEADLLLGRQVVIRLLEEFRSQLGGLAATVDLEDRLLTNLNQVTLVDMDVKQRLLNLIVDVILQVEAVEIGYRLSEVPEW